MKPIKSKDSLLRDLLDSYDTLQHNYNALSKAQADYLKEQMGRSIKESTKVDTKFQKHMKRISTLLHNYLASFYSFLAIVRAISKNVYSVGFEKEYEKKWKMFITEEVNAFVRDLRNFVQHRRLPVVGAGIDLKFTYDSAVANEPCGVVYALPSLRIEDLLLYEKWSAASKRFLKRQPKEIEIMPFVSSAHKNTFDFFLWLINQIKNW